MLGYKKQTMVPATRHFSTRMVENMRRGGAGVHLSLVKITEEIA